MKFKILLSLCSRLSSFSQRCYPQVLYERSAKANINTLSHMAKREKERENYTFYGYDFIGFLHSTYFFMAEYAALGNNHIGLDAIYVIGQRSFLQLCCCWWMCRRRRHFFIILSIFHYKICWQISLFSFSFDEWEIEKRNVGQASEWVMRVGVFVFDKIKIKIRFTFLAWERRKSRKNFVEVSKCFIWNLTWTVILLSPSFSLWVILKRVTHRQLDM